MISGIPKASLRPMKWPIRDDGPWCEDVIEEKTTTAPVGALTVGESYWLWPDGSLRKEKWPPEGTQNDNGALVVTEITDDMVVTLVSEDEKGYKNKP